MNFLVTNFIQKLLPQWQYDLFCLDKTCGQLRKFDAHEVKTFLQSKQYVVKLILCGSEIFNASVSTYRVRRINFFNGLTVDPFLSHYFDGTFFNKKTHYYILGYKIEKIYLKM